LHVCFNEDPKYAHFRDRLTKGEIKYDKDALQNGIKPPCLFWSASEAKSGRRLFVERHSCTVHKLELREVKIARVGVADESRNALKMAFYGIDTERVFA
jgi:hypothetical protein